MQVPKNPKPGQKFSITGYSTGPDMHPHTVEYVWTGTEWRQDRLIGASGRVLHVYDKPKIKPRRKPKP